jgi:L-alanine-DL-glutamate epimerase-like enolase superfamily enzyme
MELYYKPENIYFNYPFKIAHGVRTYTSVVFVKIVYNNIAAYGEASLPPYLSETQQSVITFLEKIKPILEKLKYPFDLDSVLSEIDQVDANNTAAKAAIDIALHDLIGKIKNETCRKGFGLDEKDSAYTTYTIGIDSEEIIKEKVSQAADFKILKVKLNGENDKKIINAIRSVSSKPIAVDVNQGWTTKEKALKMIEWLSTKNVLLIEQPLPKNNLEDSFWLFERSPLPVIADESVQRLVDIETIKNCFHGINIKLMKCTGINEARKMIVRARELNLKVLLGCMSESSCAVSAAAQLSSLVDYADLDAPLLIKNDFFEGIKFIDGKIYLSEMPGINSVLRENIFEEGK